MKQVQIKTKQLVLQATPFCNLDCRYCYLPDRDKRGIMAVETAICALKFVAENDLAESELDIRWHAGEPLVVPCEFYKYVIPALNEIAFGYGINLNHSLQTNGVLITDKYCKLFNELNIEVGVSLDGPKDLHDNNRVFRNKKGSFSQVMQGIELLRRNGVDFSIICVLGSENVKFPDDLFQFFMQLNPKIIGFNVEEMEGVNTSSTILNNDYLVRYENFMARVIALGGAHPKILIREYAQMRRMLLKGSDATRNLNNEPFSILTVDVNGFLYTYSPELAGLKSEGFAKFSVGNVFNSNLESIFNDDIFKELTKQVERGVKACQNSCQYFSVCGGGSPVNKLSETGSFSATETMYCKMAFQSLANVVVTSLEQNAYLIS